MGVQRPDLGLCGAWSSSWLLPLQGDISVRTGRCEHNLRWQYQDSEHAGLGLRRWNSEANSPDGKN